MIELDKWTCCKCECENEEWRSWCVECHHEKCGICRGGFLWYVPSCYKWREDGFCIGEWSNDYWSYKKCRFCSLFPIEWCGNCKWIRFSGPHATCGHPSMGTDFHGWMSMKDSGHATSKDKIGQKSNCSMYERG